MPTDKIIDQNIFASAEVKQFSELVHNIQNASNQQELHRFLSTSIPLIARINPQCFDSPTQFLHQIVRPFLLRLCSPQCCEWSEQNSDLNTIIEEVIKKIFINIIQIFTHHKNNFIGLKTISEVLKIKSSPTHKKKKMKQDFYQNDYVNVQNEQGIQFCRQCKKVMINEWRKYPKIIWGMSLDDMSSLIQIFDQLFNQIFHQLKVELNIDGLAQLYFTEINAYFLSCRPELMKQIKQQKMINFCEQLSGLFNRREDTIKVYFMQINTALALMKSNVGSQKMEGIKLLNKMTYQIYFERYTKIPENRYVDWLQNNEIYSIFLTHETTEEMFDEGEDILKFLNKTKKPQERIAFILNLLKSNNDKNKHLQSFCFKEIEPYSLNFQSKELIYQHIASLPDYVNMNFSYFQILGDLPLKCYQHADFHEKLFELGFNMIQQAFNKWPQKYRRKMSEVFRKIMGYFRKQCLPQKKIELKVLFLKNIIFRLFKEFNYFSIYWFRIFFIEAQYGKTISNNPFQQILAELIQKQSFYDKLFTFMETLDQDSPNDSETIRSSIDIAKFIIRKANSKQDINPKYISLIVKYSEIYQEILNVCGYSNGSAKLKQIFTLIQTIQNFPFSIYKFAFISVNDYEFQELQNSNDPDQIQHRLRKPPQQLQYYEETVNLLMKTDQSHLRRDLSQFITSLYIYYSYNKEKNGEEELIKFMTELLNNFVKGAINYSQQSNCRNQLLGILQLINQVLRATDVLGVGERKPHCSLVSTTTISLTITNNITFGNDVIKQIHRNFPSNMVLFEALTIIGLDFKCGPEQIILRQGKRKIYKKMNGKTLEQLNFKPQQSIFAQKNPSNRLDTPLTIKDHEMTEIARKAVVQIFNRFAYDGKMGLIQVTNFIRQTFGVDFLSTDRRVIKVFQDFDADHDDILLLPDLMNYFYKNLDVSVYERQNTLKRLHNLRYRKNLTLYSQPLDITPRSYLMLRYRMESAQYHNALFRLSSLNDQAIAKKSQQLLLYLPTDKQMRNDMERIEISIQQSQFMRHYQLIIIESELNINNCNIQEQALIKSKHQKIQNFIKNKKEESIFNIIEMYEKKTDKTEMEKKSFIICLKILRNLIIIGNLADRNILEEQFDTAAFPKLPKTPFFAAETKKSRQSNNIINFETVLVLQLTQQEVNFEQILSGCFHPEVQIRRISCNFIYIWQIKTNWKYDLFSVNIEQTYCQEWFSLLQGIIKNCKNIHYENILANTIRILSERRQDFDNRYDKLMNGYLNILYGIVLKRQITNYESIQKLIVKLLNSTISPINRSIIYDIYMDINEDNLLEYFDKMLTDVLPSQQCQIRQQYLGIRNLGSTCYMNSILQQFFMIQKFKQLVLNRQIQKQYKKIEVNGKESIDDFMYQLQRMYYHLQYSKKKYYIPTEFCLTCKDMEGKPINTAIQEDSHQFLNKLVQNAENTFTKDEKLADLQRILCAKTLTELQCAHCLNKIQKVQTAYSLMLQVKDHNSLQQSLRKFIQKQQISDYFCEKCNRKVKTINKKTYLHQLPEIVIFNLQRIIYDPHRGERIKVHSSMTFPQELNMQQFMKHSALEQMNTNYRLKGVVVHTGTSQGGHYFSIIKTQGKWYKFNDQNATPFDVNDLPRQTFGGFESKDGWATVDYSTNAYILFYERTEIQKLQIIDPENTFRFQIDKQNFQMIKQLQVHQQCFFKAIDNLYTKNRMADVVEKMNQEMFYDGPYEKQTLIRRTNLLRVTKKALTFLNVFSSIKFELKLRIGQNINELFYYLPEQTLSLFAEFSVQNFIENALINSDVHYRTIITNLFMRNLLVYMRYYGVNLKFESQQSANIKQILSELLQFLNHERLYSNISKSSQYFTLWKDLIIKDEQLKHFFIQQNVLFKMLDLLMGRQSLYMIYHPKAQDLPNAIVPIIIQIIAKLVELKKNMIGHSQTQLCLYETTPMEAKILMDITLYKRIQRLKYDHELVGSIITHYSIHDFHYSMLIADFFLSYLNEADKIDNNLFFFKHLKAFIDIEDDFKRHRLEWLFGVPQFKANKGYGYCLNYSDRSEYITYISGLYLNKPDQQQKRLPIFEWLFQNCRKLSNRSIMTLGVLLHQALTSQLFFNFITKIPPPNYIMKNYLNWIPQHLTFLANDHDFILQNKEVFVSQLNTFYLQLIEKMTPIASTFPIQKYIIGKDYQVKNQGKYQQNNSYLLNLKLHMTYVLDNLPDLHQNASMQKKYFSGQDPKGIAHCFISYRSKSQCQSDGKNLLVKPTVYELSGKTDCKLKLKFKGQNFNYTIILQQGFIQLNFPYMQGKIQDLLEIQRINPKEIGISQQMQETIFGKREEPIVILPPGGTDPNPPIYSDPPKIACPDCTFLNYIDMQRCEVCNYYLYN